MAWHLLINMHWIQGIAIVFFIVCICFYVIAIINGKCRVVVGTCFFDIVKISHDLLQHVCMFMCVLSQKPGAKGWHAYEHMC